MDDYLAHGLELFPRSLILLPHLRFFFFHKHTVAYVVDIEGHTSDPNRQPNSSHWYGCKEEGKKKDALKDDRVGDGVVNESRMTFLEKFGRSFIF